MEETEENASLLCERNSTLSDSTIVTRRVLEEESGGVCVREGERQSHGVPRNSRQLG